MRIDVTLPNHSESSSDATDSDTGTVVLGCIIACPQTPLRTVREHVVAIARARLRYPSDAVLYLNPSCRFGPGGPGPGSADTPPDGPSLALASREVVLAALNSNSSGVTASGDYGDANVNLLLAGACLPSHPSRTGPSVIQIAVVRLDSLLGGAAPSSLPVNKAAALAHLIKVVPGAATDTSISSAILRHGGRVAIDGNALLMKLLRSRQRATTWEDVLVLLVHSVESLATQLAIWGETSLLVTTTLNSLRQLRLASTTDSGASTDPVSSEALSAAARRLARQLVQRVAELGLHEDITQLALVFDGLQAVTKQRTFLKRKNLESLLSFAAAAIQARQRAQRHVDGDLEGFDRSAIAFVCKILSATAFVRDTVVDEATNTFSSLVSVEVADFEADPRLAKLGRDGYLVICEDADVALDGSPNLFRRMSLRDGTGLYIQTEMFLNHRDSPACGLSSVDLAIASALAGNESSLVHVKGVGPKTVWEHVQSALENVSFKSAPTIADRLLRVLRQEPFSLQHLPPSFFELTLLGIAVRLVLHVSPQFTRVDSISFNLPHGISFCPQTTWTKMLAVRIPDGTIPYVKSVSNDGTPRTATGIMGADIIRRMISTSTSVVSSTSHRNGLMAQRLGNASNEKCLLRRTMHVRQQQLDCTRYGHRVTEALIGSAPGSVISPSQPLAIWSASGQLMPGGLVGHSGIRDAIGPYADVYRLHSSALLSHTTRSERIADLDSEAIAYDVSVSVKSDLGFGRHSVSTVCSSVWPARAGTVQQIFDLSTPVRAITDVYFCRANALMIPGGPPRLSTVLQCDFLAQYPSSSELTARQRLGSVGRSGAGSGGTSAFTNALSPLFGDSLVHRGPIWQWLNLAMFAVVDADMSALLPQVRVELEGHS